MGQRRRRRPRPDIGDATACHAAAVSKVYGRRDTAVHALRDVTLSIERGTFTAIMGPSGSGKSTLLHCLAALDSPTAGRVFLGHTELTALSRRQQAQVRRDRIGFVFQAYNLVPTLDALENITLPQRLAGRRPDRQWLDHIISKIDLGDRLRHRPSELSGGQQQRVALARALVGRPEVVFADEPTGNLDTTASAQMLTLLRDAVDQFDQTVITVTHDPAIARYADRVVFLLDGRVVDQADRPDVDQILDRVRATNGIGETHAGSRQDGHDTMRSRRRRQSDTASPGRPMVGSDDEVEVARQERWLQRIREQFEAEQGGEQHAGDGAGRDPWATEPTFDRHGDPDPYRALTPRHDEDAHLPHGDAEAAPPMADRPGARWSPPTDHLDEHPHPIDDGWLPTQRSWAEGPDPSADAVGRPVEEHASPAEPAPWSRPDEPPAIPDDAAGPSPGTGWGADNDPWAPPDRDLAEEYRSDTGTFPPRGWQPDDRAADPGATTGGWRHDDAHHDDARRDDARRDDWRQDDARHDDWRHDDARHDDGSAAPDPTPDASNGHPSDAGWRVPRFQAWRPPADDGAPNGRAHDDGWRDDSPTPHRNGHDGGASDDARGRGHAEGDEPIWTPRAHDPETEDRGATEPDPWRDVWDTTGGNDATDDWRPPADTGQHAHLTDDIDTPMWASRNGHMAAGARPAPPVVQPVGHHDTPPPGQPALPADVPVAGVTHDDAPTAHDDPATNDDAPTADGPEGDTTDALPISDSPEEDAPPASEAGRDGSAAAGDAGSSQAPQPARRPFDHATPDAPATPRPHANGHAADAGRDGRRARPPLAEPLIPPELASLRNPRRPDEPPDPAAALQSLQAQLARLGSARGARTGAWRPRGRETGSDTKRSEPR